MKTNRAYLCNPDICPYCDGTERTVSKFELRGSGVQQVINCFDCGARWQDTYRLIDVTFLNKGKDYEQR